MLLPVGVLCFDKAVTPWAIFDFTWAFMHERLIQGIRVVSLKIKGFKRTFFKSKIAQLILINSLNIA